MNPSNSSAPTPRYEAELPPRSGRAPALSLGTRGILVLPFTILAASLSLAADTPFGTASGTPATPTPAAGIPTADGLPELETVQAPYLRNIASLHTARDTRIAGVTKMYVTGLERLQREITARGDLDGALQAKAELERVAGGKEPSVAERKLMPAALVALRHQFENECNPILAAARQQEEQQTKTYLAALDALQKRLTVENKLEKALLVKAEREKAPASAAASDPMNSGHGLLSKDNEKKWKVAKGDWKIHKDVLVGAGDSATVFRDSFDPPFTMQFKIKVIEGMRPRVKFGAFSFANEGYDTTFALYPNTAGKSFHYKRKTEYRIAIAVSDKSVELTIDDKLIGSYPGTKAKIENIEFCAGDSFSKGRVEFRDITVSK